MHPRDTTAAGLGDRIGGRHVAVFAGDLLGGMGIGRSGDAELPPTRVGENGQHQSYGQLGLPSAHGRLGGHHMFEKKPFRF